MTTAIDFKRVIKKLKDADQEVATAAATSLNLLANILVDETTQDIVSQVNLSSSYVKQKIQQLRRANRSNLKTEITASEQGTLLARYPHIANKNGVSVAVNKGGYRHLPKAFIVKNLKSSGATGVAMSAKDAYDYFRSIRTQNTSSLAAKIQRLKAKKDAKKRKIEVLHARSINQMFNRSVDRLKPELAERFKIIMKNNL